MDSKGNLELLDTVWYCSSMYNATGSKGEIKDYIKECVIVNFGKIDNVLLINKADKTSFSIDIKRVHRTYEDAVNELKNSINARIKELKTGILNCQEECGSYIELLNSIDGV